MPLFERQVESRTVFEGRIVKLRLDVNELQDGRRAGREIVEHPGGVAVLPVDSDGNAYMVRQFRAPFAEVVLEAPAGKLEPGEDPLPAGVRELAEEVGASAGRITPLGRGYVSPGFCTEVIHMYLATDLTFGDSHPDDGEFLECERIPLDALYEMTLRGEILDAKTQIAVLKAHALIASGEVTL